MSSAYRHCIFIQSTSNPVAWRFHLCHIAVTFPLRREQGNTMPRTRIRQLADKKSTMVQACSGRDYPGQDKPCISIGVKSNYHQKAAGCHCQRKRLKWSRQTVEMADANGCVENAGWLTMVKKACLEYTNQTGSFKILPSVATLFRNSIRFAKRLYVLISNWGWD